MYDGELAWRRVDEYFVETLIEEDDGLVAARESGLITTMPLAEVAPNQGKLLGLFVEMVGASRVLEFGTLAGYSTIWFARAVGASGRVVSFELEEQNAAVARANLERAAVSDRVEIMVGPARESAQQLIDSGTEAFDFVFIDADKPSNPEYLRASLELTRPGSVIVIDNVVRNGAVIDPDSTDDKVQGVRTVLADIANDSRLEATSLQTVGSKGWDGFTIIRRAR